MMIALRDNLVDRLSAKLMDHPVRVEQSYVARGHAEAYLVPAGDFLKDYRWFAERGLMCPETLVPNLDAELLDGLRHVAGTSDSNPTVLVHLGYPGSSSPIHFDWDFRTVLHVNLRGKKSLAVAAPDGGLAMPTLINSIPFDLSNLPAKKQRSLLSLIDAEQHPLGAGQGIRFPPLWWHAAIYQQPSLSLSFRFDEVRALRPIAALPRSAELQRLAWLIHDNRKQIPIETVGRIVDLFLSEPSSWQTRHNGFLAKVRQIENECRQTLGMPLTRPGYPPHLLGLPDHVRPELRQAYALPRTGTARDPVHSEEVDLIRSYVFEAGDAGVSEANQRALAGYAHAVRMARRP